MTKERVSEKRCTDRGKRKQPHSRPKLHKKQKVIKKKVHYPHVEPLPPAVSPIHYVLSSSTTPPGSSSSGTAAITTISLPRLVMISGGEKIGEFLFNLIFDLARVERAAMMMMMMMSVVVRIFSTLLFVSKNFYKILATCKFHFLPKRGEAGGGGCFQNTPREMRMME